MVDKKVLIVTLFLVVGAAFVLMTDSKSGKNSKDDLSGNYLLESQSIALGEVSEISLSKNSDKILIAKNEDSSWRLSSGFPVDASKVASFLEGLEKTKLQRVVTRSKNNFNDFGLENASVVKISSQNQATDTQGKDSLIIKVGSQRDKGGQYIAIDEQALAYLASQAINVNVEESHWEYRGLLDIGEELVRKVDFGSVQMTRDKPGESFEILTVSEEQEKKDLNQVAKLLEGITFQKRFSADYASAVEAFKKAKTTTVHLFSGKSVKAMVGETKSNDVEKFFLKLQVAGESLTDHEKWLNRAMAENSFEITKAQSNKLLKQTSDLIVAKKP